MIIDGSNLAHRAFNKFEKLKSQRGIGTGLVYGTLRLLQQYIFRFKPEHVLVTFDTWQSKKSNFRNKILDTYKGKRETRIDRDYTEFNRQIRLTRRLLRHLGIQVVYDRTGLGFESDDYIAYFAKKHNGKVLIVSSDKDFSQLINKDVKIFNPSRDKVVSTTNCKDVYGWEPEQCVDFLSLVGDTSDNIPGYYQIGPKKAEQFLSQFGSIDDFLINGEEFKGIDNAILLTVSERNRALIDLDYSSGKVRIPPLWCGRFDVKKLRRNFNKYSLLSFREKSFIDTFKTIKQWNL